MPLYEYKCDACGHQFEKIQKFSDPPLEACERCGAPARKLMSSPAIQFKGSGWYITDYAKNKDTKAGSSETKDTKEAKDTKAAAASSSSSDAAKTETKPETKSS